MLDDRGACIELSEESCKTISKHGGGPNATTVTVRRLLAGRRLPSKRIVWLRENGR